MKLEETIQNYTNTQTFTDDEKREIEGYKYDLVNRMFIQTADHDYVVARFSFINKLYHNFLWSSLQALEKYFKAILLLNGKSSVFDYRYEKDKNSKFSHDLVKLFDCVKSLHDNLDFGNFQKPEYISDYFWLHENLDGYIKRLSEYGEANNRYNTYGFLCAGGDIWKLDHLVWHTRRLCVPFNDIYSDNETWIEYRINQPLFWDICGNFLIEKAVSGELSKDLTYTILAGNHIFSPDKVISLVVKTGFYASNSPINDLFESSGNKNLRCSELRLEAIKWAFDHVKFCPNHVKEIKEVLGI